MSETTEVAIREWEATVPLVVQEAQGLAITSQADYEGAADFVKMVTLRLKQLEDVFGPIAAKQYAAWKETKAQQARFAEPLQEAKKTVVAKIAAWDLEQERLRREEQRRLEEEARKAAEEELLAEAVAAEAAGVESAVAEAILSAPLAPKVVVVPPAHQRAEGVSKARDNWSCELVSLAALVKHAAAHPEALGLLQVNQVAANQMARALKENFNVPGLKAVNRPTVSVRVGV
jgi:hypothetical protein